MNQDLWDPHPETTMAGYMFLAASQVIGANLFVLYISDLIFAFEDKSYTGTVDGETPFPRLPAFLSLHVSSNSCGRRNFLRFKTE